MKPTRIPRMWLWAVAVAGAMCLIPLFRQKPRTLKNEIELTDLGLVLLEVEFDKPISENKAIFFSETEITNKMYATYLADTNQMRDDAEIEKKSEEGISSTASPVIEINDKSALWRKGAIPSKKEDHPVSLITIGEASDYCKWMNSRYQLSGSFRLPTEEEWFFAAYGTKRKYPWGNEKKKWTGKSTESVKARPELKTPDGLYGMWGNVSELVLSPWNGYGGKIEDIYTPFITTWLGESYQEEFPAHPRQDDWGYTHSLESRSDEWGFRIVFVPE